MKRLLVVMYVLCLSFSGIAYAEEGQNVQNAQPQPVVQAQQAPVQGAPEQEKAALGEAKPVQAKPDVMPEIVVTATKTRQEARKTPAKVEVVKAEQLEETNVTTVDQSLASLPGAVSTRREGAVGLTYPFAGIQLRGFPRASETLVLLDGQPLNNYEGNTQWWSMPVESIDRVEVVKGPLSSLYGGGAMGGVINIISKTDYAPLSFSLTKGSYDFTGISIASGFRVKDVTYHVAYDNKDIGPIDQYYTSTRGSVGEVIDTATGETTRFLGYRSWTTEINNLELGANWDITTDSSLGFKFINSTFSWVPETSTSLYDSTYDITGSERAHSTKIYNLSYYNKMLKNVEFSANIGLTDNYEDLFIYSPGSADSTCPNTRYNLGGQANITLPLNNTLSVGLDASKSQVVSEDLSQTPIQNSKGKMLNAGLFLQDQWNATDFLILYAGARYDYWKAYEGKNNSPTGDDIDNRTKHHVSPKVSVVVLPDAKTTIRASAGDAFRSPAIWDIYAYRYVPGRGSRLPNPDLDPETARCYEAGIERALTDRLSVSGTYFSNHIKDMIYRVTIPDTDPEDSQNQNVAEAYSKGYEVTVNYKASDAVSTYANWTHTQTKITDAGEFVLYSGAAIEDKEFTSVPEDIYNFGLNLKQGAFYTDVLVQYVGDQYYEEDNSDTIDGLYGGYDPRTTVDITVGYKFLKNCSASLSVLNASDVKYWEGTDRNPGRTFMAKTSLSF
ncbi:MAG: TonB-dependent receptor [Syntrophaceae bacterium]